MSSLKYLNSHKYPNLREWNPTGFHDPPKPFPCHPHFVSHRWQIILNFLIKTEKTWTWGQGPEPVIWNGFSGGVWKSPADGRLCDTRGTRRAWAQSGCVGERWGSLGGRKLCHSAHSGKASPGCGSSCECAAWSRGWTSWGRDHSCRASRQCGSAGEPAGLKAVWTLWHRCHIERASVLCVSSGAG